MDMLINTGPTTEFVPVRDRNGALHHISLQPKGRVALAPDMQVDPEFARQSPNSLLLGTQRLRNTATTKE